MKTPLLSTPMRYFLEVARTGSINQAAGRLYVAGSAVSRQIAKLEESLGAQLFDRQARGMRLTPAGERLSAHLSTAVADAEPVIASVRELGGRQATRVRLACTEGFAAHFMPPVMLAFQQAHAHAQLDLYVGSPDEVSAQLTRGEVDVGLKYVAAPEPGLRVEHHASAPVLAILRPDHPLARRPSLTLEELVQFPLAVGHRGVTTRQLFDLACANAGLSYQPEFVSNFSSVLLRLLRSPGILLSGQLTVQPLIDRGELVARPILDDTLGRRRVQVLSLEGRSLPPLARALVEHLATTITAAPRRRRGRARQR